MTRRHQRRRRCRSGHNRCNGSATFHRRGLLSRLSRRDHGPVVIDEVAGMLISLLFLPATWPVMAAAFVAFRVFDIVKPWPASWADRELKGGLGIMLDDILAGLYAAAVVAVLFL